MLFMSVFVLLSCLFISALWSPAGKGLFSWLALVCDVYLCFCHFPMWYPGSGVVIDLSIPDLCHLSYFVMRSALFHV